MRTLIAAAFLVGSAGLALAQTQAAGSAQAVQTPSVRAASPAAQDPGVNPSAAGTQPGGRSGPIPDSAKAGGEHSGSKNLTANDHPFAALKYNRVIRRRQGWQQSLQRQTGNSGQVQQRAQNKAGR
jgi:hypothetical protein